MAGPGRTILVSSADLSYMRSSQESNTLPDTVTILEQQTTPDGTGGFSEAWVETYELVPARLSQVSGSESIMAGREHLRADYMLTVPYSQRIDEGMRVQLNSATFEVVFVSQYRSLSTAKRCLVRSA